MAETIASQRETAIVTGGSRGLGRCIAEAVSTAKTRVVVLARHAAKLEAAARTSAVWKLQRNSRAKLQAHGSSRFDGFKT